MSRGKNFANEEIQCNLEIARKLDFDGIQNVLSAITTDDKQVKQRQS